MSTRSGSEPPSPVTPRSGKHTPKHRSSTHRSPKQPGSSHQLRKQSDSVWPQQPGSGQQPQMQPMITAVPPPHGLGGVAPVQAGPMSAPAALQMPVPRSQGQPMTMAIPPPVSFAGVAPVHAGPMSSPAGQRMPVPLQMPVGYLQPQITGIPGCPRGLEYLCAVDQILVHQQLQVIEVVVPYEQRNKYVVKNTMGQFIFVAVEESGLCQRCCCGIRRAFQMKVMDYHSVEVLRFIRPLRCECVCCFCCLQEMHVYAPPDTLLGSVKMQFNPIFPTFLVLDGNQRDLLKIQGPFITSACCNDVVFDIFTSNGGTKVGFISKNWTGLLREFFTDIDNFTLVFPINLDAKIKAVLLGALFLIVSQYCWVVRDFLLFERGNGGGNLLADLPGALLG
ncbi:hypothetical protein HPB48_011137 [Haemaphysalis longicornis]|uniref:Phospholipid scramblase n=1 Tax=Haemaphysalis longicornis TaxID=44386 RepID=A0A9J6GKA7_HAELO|nr:hypothetical protein HPB48_011137 [Haemaphysalis longicornis]